MELILLPVSLGEAMDKLSILEIKLRKISDSRRSDCEKEYDLLAERLDPYRRQFAYHYRILKEINLGLWDIQDRFHGKDVGSEEGAAMCRLILTENDRRFRVKAKINVASGSPLREQKGYREKMVFLNSPRELEILKILNGAVRYFSTAFDKVMVACRQKDEAVVRLMYEDDPSIEVIALRDGKEFESPGEWPDEIKGCGDITVLSCGFGSVSGASSDMADRCYDELNLGREIRAGYHYHAGEDKPFTPAN